MMNPQGLLVKLPATFLLLSLMGCSSTRLMTAVPTSRTPDRTLQSRQHSSVAAETPLPMAKQPAAITPPASELAQTTDASEAVDKEKAGEIALVSAQQGAPRDPLSNSAPLVPSVESHEPSLVTSRWTLADLEATALQNNPAIHQASASASKAAGFHEQVGTKPNPTFGYNATQLADQGTDQHVAFVEQDIVMGGKLARNRAVLSQEIQSQLWEVETQRYRVLTDVRQRFFEALAAQRRMQLAAEFHEIAAKGVEVAQARLDAKEGSRPELLQAEIQLNQVTVQRRQAEAAFEGAWNQLMAVAGVPRMAAGELEGTLPETVEISDIESFKMTALTSSPELQAARAKVARARANIDRQEVQAIPNLSFMVAAGVDNGTNSEMVNAQVGLPVPLFNRNAGNISAAHAEMNRACQELRRIELAIESRMARAAQDYESAAAAVTQYHQMILPKANETLTLTESAYEAGEFGFLEILVARRTYFDANLEYVTAQSELAQSRAYLEGLALAGGLENTPDVEFDSGLRDQSLSGQ